MEFANLALNLGHTFDVENAKAATAGDIDVPAVPVDRSCRTCPRNSGRRACCHAIWIAYINDMHVLSTRDIGGCTVDMDAVHAHDTHRLVAVHDSDVIRVTHIGDDETAGAIGYKHQIVDNLKTVKQCARARILVVA